MRIDLNYFHYILKDNYSMRVINKNINIVTKQRFDRLFDDLCDMIFDGSSKV